MQKARKELWEENGKGTDSWYEGQTGASGEWKDQGTRIDNFGIRRQQLHVPLLVVIVLCGRYARSADCRHRRVNWGSGRRGLQEVRIHAVQASGPHGTQDSLGSMPHDFIQDIPKERVT